MKEFKFDRYRLFYVSGPSDYAAKITLYSGNNRLAMVFFLKDKDELPANIIDVIPMKIYYHLNSFSDIVNLIENENPLSVYVYNNKQTCEIGSQEFMEG